MKLFVRLIAALSLLLGAATAAISEASGQGWLGVQVAQVTKADADTLGWEDLHGVKVVKTVPGGPAEQAGLMPGDLILSVGGVEADDVRAFVASVSSKGANAKVKLRLIRNGKEKLVSVILGARPLDLEQTQKAAPQATVGVVDLKWNAISIASAPLAGVRGHIILIANSDYKFFTKLDGPGRDINAAASAFAQIGFRTTVLADPSKEQILKAIKTAGEEGEQQLIGLYYSGHAAEINNQNTVVLTGFDPSSESYADSLLPVQAVLSSLTSANANKIFIAFDACRVFYDPKEDQTTVEKKRALMASVFRSYRGAEMPSEDLRLLNRKEYSVLFSTSEKETALDETDNGISPFTVSFVTALGRETSFIQAMLLAKRLTEEKTGGEQSPEIDIKWNSDLQYATSKTVTNSALFELNEPLTPEMFNSSPEDLKKYTKHLTDQGLEYDALVFSDEQAKACKDTAETEHPHFYWSVGALDIEQCLLKKIGLKQDGKMIFGFDPKAGIYSAGQYFKGLWKLDIDFDGKPETLRAELRNADMSLLFKSASKEVEFRGLVGPNIRFLGLYDFNKDGVLDIFLEVVVPSKSALEETELIILDGKKLANERARSEKCIQGAHWVRSKICDRQFALMKSLHDSLFAADIDQAYYGGDILQYAIYNDWHIKSWELDDLGSLSIITHSPTWAYEQFIPQNYQPQKKIVFNPGSGRLDVNVDDQKSFTLQTVLDRVVAGAN
jgi:hypothetical protein